MIGPGYMNLGSVQWWDTDTWTYGSRITEALNELDIETTLVKTDYS